jgi:PIN domain nuclease of toxin-antitoxin system
MIVLDTHIWIWWVHRHERLSVQHVRWLQENEENGLGVSVISCWEVAKLVELNRLALPLPIDDWFDLALAYPGIRLLDFTPRIALEATRLPPGFHRDPADQIIVATARWHDCPLLTVDERILNYPHVRTLK